jgi:hypothetical protein
LSRPWRPSGEELRRSVPRAVARSSEQVARRLAIRERPVSDAVPPRVGMSGGPGSEPRHLRHRPSPGRRPRSRVATGRTWTGLDRRRVALLRCGAVVLALVAARPQPVVHNGRAPTAARAGELEAARAHVVAEHGRDVADRRRVTHRIAALSATPSAGARATAARSAPRPGATACIRTTRRAIRETRSHRPRY